LPAELAHAARSAQADARATVLVLLDRRRAVLAAVGPFTDADTPDGCHPTPDVGSDVDRLIVPLHVAGTAPNLP
jgi:hypothetical protein